MSESELVSQTASEGSGALKDITFGSVAGMTSKLFEHPFDLVKVRLQSQPTDRPATFKGPLDCFQQTWAREGAKGLYRGVSAPIVGAAAENASLFLIYNKIQDIIRTASSPGHTIFGSPAEDVTMEGLSEKAWGKKREMSMGELALAAATAGACASFVLTPIELVKCRMQVQAMSREVTVPRTVASTPSLKSSAAAARNQAPLQGPFAIVRSTIAENGVRGLWLGQVGTLFRETGGSAAWFSAYEMVSRAILRYHTENPSTGRIRSDPVTGRAIPLTKKDLKTWELVLAGASAGVSYNIVLFPADCVKSSMQTQAELNRDAPGSAKRPAPKFWNVARGIYKSRGIAGLYAGCGVTVMRSAPSSAMIFLIYETLEKKFGHLF